MNDNDTKPELPIPMILGARYYPRIKVPEMPRVGSTRESVAELTCFNGLLCPQEMRSI